MEIEKIARHNIDALTGLVLELCSDCEYDEERDSCKRILKAENETCFLAKENDEYIGFVYLTLRNDYVEGTSSRPVVYVERIYVRPVFNKAVIGKRLVELGEEWGRQKECKEIASDAELSNDESVEFHLGAGFKEIKRVACFAKELG